MVFPWILTELAHFYPHTLIDIEHVKRYGPFITVPCPLHISPLITREKHDLNKKRTIMDLSWPPNFSVNAGVKKDIYLNTIYTLHYPSIDNITEALVKLGPPAQLYKIDIS